MPKRALTIAAWLPAGACAAFVLLRMTGWAPVFPLYPALAFTPYAIPVAIAAALWALALRRRGAALTAGLAALVAVALLAPRVIGSDQAPVPEGAPELRVLSVNLALGGADTGEIAALAASEDADVISLQELTPRIARRIGSGPLGDAYPHRIFQPGSGGAGSGLMARRSLTPVTPEGFDGTNTTVATLTARGSRGDSPVEVWSVHPHPPISAEDVRHLRAYIDAIPPPDPGAPPRILAGDFNSSLDHPDLRELTRRGYHDAAASLGAGLVPTRPSNRFPPKVTIDHALGDGRISFSDFSTHEITGTDHFAIAVTAAVAAPAG